MATAGNILLTVFNSKPYLEWHKQQSDMQALSFLKEMGETLGANSNIDTATVQPFYSLLHSPEKLQVWTPDAATFRAWLIIIKISSESCKGAP